MMPIEQIPDWEQRIARQDAFWHGEILDRPVVIFHYARPEPAAPKPAKKTYATLRERWMDAEYVAERAVAGARNTVFGGDALPFCFPNLGPELFSAFFGCEMDYGEGTSWTTPNLHDWADVGKIKFSTDNFYWKKINEMTDVLLEAGKGIFYTGLTDLHPGGDAIAAFRDPEQLNYDMLEAVDEIKALLAYMDETYYFVYDHFYRKLTAAGQAITTWPGIVSSKRWYVPSNDFSCMISKAMFDDVFLPGIAAECRFYEASIYHLDGPDALRHLDSLLAIPELNAIQWVYGAGKGRASDWIPVYRQCQQAGKGLQITAELDELDTLMDALRPEGVWLQVVGIGNEDEGNALLDRVAKWR